MGGCTNACIYMGTHSQPLLQNRLMDFDEFGRDEVIMATHMHEGVSAQGRIPGRAKIGHEGSPYSKNFYFRPEGYSNKPKQSNNLEACGKKCCYFLFHSEVKFLTHVRRLFGLRHFGIF